MQLVLTLFKAIKVAKVYRDGDGYGFVWRWWNPLSWIIAPIVFVVACGFDGIPQAWQGRSYLGFGMSQYFIKNPDKLEWLK